eukprot:gene6930-biopygen23963
MSQKRTVAICGVQRRRDAAQSHGFPPRRRARNSCAHRPQKARREKRPRPRPVRVRFFKFYRAPRVRPASGPRPAAVFPRPHHVWGLERRALNTDMHELHRHSELAG